MRDFRRKSINSSLSLSNLPEDIVAHIFSYLHLDNKTAIQLSLLSKELHSILQKRPALVFDHRSSDKASDTEYENRYREELKYFVSTLERYQEENIHLRTVIFRFKPNLPIDHGLLKGFIQLSIQKGITNLNLSMPESVEKCYVVPQSIFEVESLVELSLEWCTLLPERGSVAWRNLKRLHLRHVKFGDDGVFEDIIRGTNHLSIECLEIILCQGFKTLDFNIWNANLKQLEICLYDGQTLEWNALQNPRVKPECKNLKRLSLNRTRIKDNIFVNFPRLEELEIEDCENETLNVSSISLKKITLKDSAALQMASFDVPNIVKFQFINGQYTGTVSPIPELSFRGNSSGWVSNIEMCVSADSDFLKLKKFLAALLNSSEITVTINLGGEVFLDEANMTTLPGPIIPEIQEFSVHTLERTFSLSFARAILNGIFGICRPKRLEFWHWDSDINEWCHNNFLSVEYFWNTSLPPTSNCDGLLKLLQDQIEKMKSFRTTFNLKILDKLSCVMPPKILFRPKYSFQLSSMLVYLFL